MPSYYSQLLYSVPEELRKLYRKYENVSKKIINTIWSIEFNSICLKENIRPQHSRIKHYDPAKIYTRSTKNYENHLLEQENKRKAKILKTLEEEQTHLLRDIELFNCKPEVKEPVFSELCSILENSNMVSKTRVTKKLNILYHGCNNKNAGKSICFKNSGDAFINLSSYELNADEKEFLNLGLNCHIQPKYNKIHKQTNIDL